MYVDEIMTFHGSNGNAKRASYFGLKKSTHDPYNKAMFLKKEYKAVLDFLKKNPRKGIPDCSVELGYHTTWVRLRVKDLVESKKLRPIKIHNKHLKFEVCRHV